MLFINKIESNDFNLDLITLKSGKILGIDNDQVVVYESMEDFNKMRTINRQSIDLSKEKTTKEFNDYFPDQSELSIDVIKHHASMHDLPVDDMLISFAGSIYAECKMNKGY
jgi:hypothetical protein